jgi:hypothetical protein
MTKSDNVIFVVNGQVSAQLGLKLLFFHRKGTKQCSSTQAIAFVISSHSIDLSSLSFLPELICCEMPEELKDDKRLSVLSHGLCIEMHISHCLDCDSATCTHNVSSFACLVMPDAS